MNAGSSPAGGAGGGRGLCLLVLRVSDTGYPERNHGKPKAALTRAKLGRTVSVFTTGHLINRQARSEAGGVYYAYVADGMADWDAVENMVAVNPKPSRRAFPRKIAGALPAEIAFIRRSGVRTMWRGGRRGQRRRLRGPVFQPRRLSRRAPDESVTRCCAARSSGSALREPVVAGPDRKRCRTARAADPDPGVTCGIPAIDRHPITARAALRDRRKVKYRPWMPFRPRGAGDGGGAGSAPRWGGCRVYARRRPR